MENDCQLRVLNRANFNFCVRSNPLRGTGWRTSLAMKGLKKVANTILRPQTINASVRGFKLARAPLKLNVQTIQLF